MSAGHPYRDLTAFPAASPDPGTLAWRIVRADRSALPWWFSASGDNRFDLARSSGMGTCYLADTLLGALLETIWRDIVPTGDPDGLPPIAPSEVARLVAVTVELPGATSCADVSGRDPEVQLHPAYGITDAIGVCESYHRPQEWAGAWAAHGLEGVRYRLAHGTALFGWAIFGPHGQGRLPVDAVHALERDLLEGQGLPPATVPTLEHLDVVVDDVDAMTLLSEP